MLLETRSDGFTRVKLYLRVFGATMLIEVPMFLLAVDVFVIDRLLTRGFSARYAGRASGEGFLRR